MKFDAEKAVPAPHPKSKRFKDLTGLRFGKLTIIFFIGQSLNKRVSYWKCICDCGNLCCRDARSMQSGKSLSCGCRFLSMLTKHGVLTGGKNSDIYGIWKGIVHRCLNPKCSSYPRYGGRGITLCSDWMNVVEFCNYVGPRPSKLHSIDRIDNDGNYEPGNVRWATKKEQSRNTRTNRFIDFNGEKLCLREWSDRIGISPASIVKRIKKGLPMDKVLSSTKWNRK